MRDHGCVLQFAHNDKIWCFLLLIMLCGLGKIDIFNFMCYCSLFYDFKNSTFFHEMSPINARFIWLDDYQEISCVMGREPYKAWERRQNTLLKPDFFDTAVVMYVWSLSPCGLVSLCA